MIYVSALASREIRALLLALKQAEPTIRKEVNNRSKLAVTEIWKQELASTAAGAFGKQQRARAKVLVNTAKATVGNRGVTLTSATTGRPLKGGLNPKTQWHALEFGGDKRVRTVSSTSKLGRSYKLTRDVNAQLDPRKQGGYVIWPTVATTTPRILSLWIQTAVKTLVELVEGK